MDSDLIHACPQASPQAREQEITVRRTGRLLQLLCGYCNSIKGDRTQEKLTAG